MLCRSALVAILLGCAAAPAPVSTPAPTAVAPAPLPPRAPDPDLHRPPPKRLLAIDWDHTQLPDDAAALALWRQIAPTGADWEAKLDEIPAAHATPLAYALLRGGNFTCTAPRTDDCAPPVYEVEPPADIAGFDDPCLRRLLALWSIAQLDYDEVPPIIPALRALAAIPPPESQLVDAAIQVVPATDHATRLSLIAIASAAGQHALANASAARLDEPHLIHAVQQHHNAGALEVLSAEGHRAVYLGAVTDEALPPRARITALGDLAAELSAANQPLPTDLRTALVTATKAKDCSVAASAARVLEQHGDPRFVPRRPRTPNIPQQMRALCVLASYEALQRSDESSLLPTYLPARGLERYTVTYDALSEHDDDGDGDPHTQHDGELVPRNEAVLPELEDLARAMHNCAATTCISDDREFRFTWTRDGLLSRIVITDRPPCSVRQKP